MKTVWILFSVANEYDQPDRAFEKLFWTEPTLKQLEEYGFEPEHMTDFEKPNNGGETRYWVEKFEEGK